MMAGKPFTQERLEAMDTIADDILEMVSKGESMRRIALRLTDKLEMHISERVLMLWADTDERRGAFAQARARAADSKAEGAVDRATDLVRDVALGLKGKEDIAAAKLANDTDKWIAGVWNREKYGEQNAAAVTINVTSLHLDSLRMLEAPARPAELAHGRARLVGDVVDVVPTQLSDLI